MSRHGMRRRMIAAGVGIAVASAWAGLALADPPAPFTATPDRPVLGAPAGFRAEAACAAPVSCTWDFGDGAGAAGRERLTASRRPARTPSRSPWTTPTIPPTRR